MHLEWQQLCCAYGAATGKIIVLDGIWGQAAPGEMQVQQNAWSTQYHAINHAPWGGLTSTRLAHNMHPHHLEMQALLGPSGAGKSTLMDILAQRKSMGQLSGFLLVNGRPATSSFIRKTAYVPQVSGEEQRRASMASAPCSALTAYTHMHAHAYNRRPSPTLYVPF